LLDGGVTNLSCCGLACCRTHQAWKEPKDHDLVAAAAAGVGSSKKRQLRLSESESDDDDDDDDDDGEGGAAPDDDEDEEFLENVDRFEAAYNFRYECIVCVGM
jgi:hypothetical protein